MIQDRLNNELIAAMRDKLPEGVNLANLLMDLLYLGKEAVYRRLRGEVPFTLIEAAVIARRLGVSLDRLVGTNGDGGYALFNLDIPHCIDPSEVYYRLLADYTVVCDRIKNEPGVELVTATNTIPQPYSLKYENLSRFRLFKWMYQHEQIDFTKHYGDLAYSPKLFEKQNEFIATIQQFERSVYIWDYMLFLYLANDIGYFLRLGLIEKGDVALIREELLAFLDELEGVAAKGRFDSGKEVQIYISDINFEATYTCISSARDTISLIRLFTVNTITSRDREVFKNVREWILSLKKFSTLISRSGEMQRIRFFNRQREIVRQIGLSSG